MRILVTVPWAERLGGAEAMLHAILDGAREHGHELEPVFFEPGPWPRELIAAGLRVEVIRAGRLREIHRWASTVRRLTGIMRRRKPDVILNWSAKTQLYGAPAAMLAGMSDRVIWWQQAIPRRNLGIDLWATLLPSAAVGCYGRVAAEAQSRMTPSRRTFVVHAGAPVPAPYTGPAPLELPSDVPVVGLVGRLQAWKGQDRLINAQALLRERGHPFHLVIVGGDSWGLSPEYARSLAPLVSRLGLDGAVTMTGEVPDAGPYIEQLDVLVNASDPEPFGIVLLEGMARGVAVLAVDSGGPGEFVEDRKTGMLARSGEPDALADALEPLLVSPDLRRELGQAGRERFMRDYTDAALRNRFFEQVEALVRERERDTPDAAAARRNGHIS
jgi:glycosyltransferase involved in cell wall biosynthesis